MQSASDDNDVRLLGVILAERLLQQNRQSTENRVGKREGSYGGEKLKAYARMLIDY